MIIGRGVYRVVGPKSNSLAGMAGMRGDAGAPRAVVSRLDESSWERKVKTVHVGVGGPSHWCDLKEEPSEPGLDWNLWLGSARIGCDVKCTFPG